MKFANNEYVWSDMIRLPPFRAIRVVDHADLTVDRAHAHLEVGSAEAGRILRLIIEVDSTLSFTCTETRLTADDFVHRHTTPSRTLIRGVCALTDDRAVRRGALRLTALALAVRLKSPQATAHLHRRLAAYTPLLPQLAKTLRPLVVVDTALGRVTALRTINSDEPRATQQPWLTEAVTVVDAQGRLLAPRTPAALLVHQQVHAALTGARLKVDGNAVSQRGWRWTVTAVLGNAALAHSVQRDEDDVLINVDGQWAFVPPHVKPYKVLKERLVTQRRAIDALAADNGVVDLE